MIKPQPIPPAEQWLKTPAAAKAVGCSERTLKREQDFRGGCLIEGEHWRRGISRNSSYIWCVERVYEALKSRTYGDAAQPMPKVTPARLGLGPGDKFSFPRQWKEWELTEARYLEHHSGYHVDLWDITDHKSLLSWLLHVGGKPYGGDVGFYDAMHDIFRWAGENETVTGKESAQKYWEMSKDG